MPSISKTAELTLIAWGISFFLTYPPYMIYIRAKLLAYLKQKINAVIYGFIHDGLGCFHCVSFYTGLAVLLLHGYGWYYSLLYAPAISLGAYILKGIVRVRWRTSL